MDTPRGDDVDARLAPHDLPNMGAFAAALQLEVWALRHKPQVLQRTRPRRFGAYKIGPFSLDGGSPASEPDPNEASGLPSCRRRRVRTGTGNGTNSARPVEKLRSCPHGPSALSCASCCHAGGRSPSSPSRLSGVRKRPMIRSMRPRPVQQRYDHRLRDLVQRTGDVTVATDLGAPR